MTIPAQKSAQVLSGHKGVGGLDSAIQPLPTAPTANASVGPETQVLSLDMPTQPLLVLVDKPGTCAYRQTKTKGQNFALPIVRFYILPKA